MGQGIRRLEHTGVGHDGVCSTQGQLKLRNAVDEVRLQLQCILDHLVQVDVIRTQQQLQSIVPALGLRVRVKG